MTTQMRWSWCLAVELIVDFLFLRMAKTILMNYSCLDSTLEVYNLASRRNTDGTGSALRCQSLSLLSIWYHTHVNDWVINDGLSESPNCDSNSWKCDCDGRFLFVDHWFWLIRRPVHMITTCMHVRMSCLLTTQLY